MSDVDRDSSEIDASDAQAPDASTEDSSAEVGGDPACWLNRVCDTCGRFVENQFASTCPYCGAPRYEQGGS